MPKVSAPSYVVSLINEWLMWYETRDGRNPLYYSSQTTEARLMDSPGVSSGQSRSKVPLDQMPPRLSVVERAMNQMPERLRLAVIYRQLEDYPGYALATGLSRASWYEAADKGYWYVAGVVNTLIDRD